ncbi:MAG: DUF58 domain-containing protein [Proteobacteria bacterium]|nr:DUF58 domain-containing protein [Pseudomonadota bacterium]
MATARLTEPFSRRKSAGIEGEAHELARVLPRLALEARQVSAQVALGIHGRRRAGPGETFWQFRPFTSGEPADRIDWRRSARDDRLYVREREWESASTWWLWVDVSASMGYVSSLALAAKRDRAIVLGFAMADLLVRGGERVGLIGLSPPLSTRAIVPRLAEALLMHGDATGDLPEGPIPGPRDRVLLLSDFILPAEAFAERFHRLTSRGATGTCLMVRDPAETLFPFSGETEFEEAEHGERWRVGNAADMAQRYKERLAAHEAALRVTTTRRGWSFLTHGTDDTAADGLLRLAMLVENGASRAFGAR